MKMMRNTLILFGAGLTFLSCTQSETKETHSSSSTTTITSADGKEEVVSAFYTVSAETFKTKMEEKPGTLIDVRTPEEVAEGKIPGSINMNFNAEDFATQLEGLDKNKTYYIYCRSGGRSGKCLKMMEEKGFKEVYNLDGGITGWIDKGYSTEK